MKIAFYSSKKVKWFISLSLFPSLFPLPFALPFSLSSGSTTSSHSLQPQYDIASFTQFKELAPDFEFSFLEARLDETTVQLAAGHDAICVFVNDDVNAAALDKLNELGVKRVALRVSFFHSFFFFDFSDFSFLDVVCWIQ